MNLKIEEFKQKLEETKNKLQKFQAGGMIAGNQDFSMRLAAKLAQAYRTNPNAKFKPNYFLDNIFHQTYQPDTKLHNPNILVSKANPGRSSEGMIVRDQASKSMYPFSNDFLDQTMTPPIEAPKRPEMPKFKNDLGGQKEQTKMKPTLAKK